MNVFPIVEVRKRSHPQFKSPRIIDFDRTMTVFTYAVATPLALYIAYRFIERTIEDYQLNKEAKANGCEPAITWRTLPFGIDRLIALMYHVSKKDHVEYLSARVLQKPTQTVNVLGNSFLITIQPENIKALLATQFEHFSLGYRRKLFFRLFGDGIFNADGKSWEHARAMLRPQFTRNQISNLVDLEVHVQKFLKAIPKDGSIIDMQNLLYSLMIDAASEALTGRSINSLDGDDKPRPGDKYSFGEAFTRSQAWILTKFRFQGLGPLVNPADYLECVRIVHQLVDDIVADALRRFNERKKLGETTKKYVFLDALIEETEDPIILREQLVNLLLAGRDTTAGMLSFTLLTLAEKPDILKKLRSEISEHFGTGTEKISFESLKACKYLQYVLNESLRLFPSVPFNSRFSTANTILPTGGGPNFDKPVFVKKGTRVDYNVWALHRRKDIWGEDALEYDPERWDPKAPNHIKPSAWEYIPFNGGPRICLGQQYALTTAGYILVRLFQHVDGLELAPGCKIQYDTGLTLMNALGANLKASWAEKVQDE